MTLAALPTDWARVRRALFRVRHHYRYTYTSPITDLKQRLVMVPPPLHGDQRLVQSDLQVRGTTSPPEITWERDQFGNRVCHVLADRVARAIDFEATYTVERVARIGPPAEEEGPTFGMASMYLRHTALTAPSGQLYNAAMEIALGAFTPLDRAERAHDWAAKAIAYQFGVTGVQTPAAMALHFGKGVCQDYAHLMLCVLRLLGIPARYVSGHLLGEGAPHAWVEAFVRDEDTGAARVIAYDPTHHRRAGLNYVTVAVGRDFSDVTMTSGYFSGGASGKLSSTKHADVVEVDEPLAAEAAA